MNPSTLQARVLVDEFLRGGVRDAVLCPGSRNAPLSFALHAAERAGRVRLHVRIDERSAGFLAVGLAAASGAPVIVVMTSGTAVANLGPAVCEANYARVPLIVLSANQPYDVLGSGVNQVIEQLGLFGTQVREAVSAGMADSSVRSGSQWRARVVRALSAATGARTGNAGPVQFDVPFREPLVPAAEAEDLASYQGGAFAGRADGGPWTEIPEGGFEIPVEIDLSVDTVVVSGHGAGVYPELAALPTVAEPTARLFFDAAQPQNPLHPFAIPHVGAKQAVICGRPTLHRQVSALLADPEVRVYALTTGPRWPDVAGNVAATGSRVVPVGEPSPAWLERCARAQAAAVASVDRALAASAATTGLQVAREVLKALRPGDQLVLGASNPVRDVAIVGQIPPGVEVRSNRGVSGIDGVVSTAVGAALSHPGRTLALLGDLTFLHDIAGLMIGPHEPRPSSLTIVVANDDGGGIFELLEQGGPEYRGGAFGDAYERIFGTPHGKDLAALCAGLGATHVLAALDALPQVLSSAADGLRVVEVRTDRAALRDLHRAMKELELDPEHEGSPIR